MQTYIHNDRSVTMDIIRKAEASGFSAIVVTVDSANCGLWRKVIPEEFFKMVATKMPNLPSLPRYLEDASVTFEDLKWVIQNSKLPVIVKGILSGEDAKKAVEIGVSAIIVSNHGGRLIERVVSTLLYIHWCAKIKDEVEKLAYQLNEEAERTEGQSGD
ncbi:peroxisomal [Trichonephila clavipes]|nr:peroxisomal [Trichonephila clavipes]